MRERKLAERVLAEESGPVETATVHAANWFGSRGRFPLPMVIVRNLSLAAVLSPVESAKMDIEHLPEALFVLESIAGEIESDAGTDGTPRTQEIILRSGFDNQFRLFHATMMPHVGC